MSIKWLFGETTTKKKDSCLVEGKHTDERIKYCKYCNCCWEKDYYQSQQKNNSSSGKNIYRYYKDFPTYGKEKEKCPKCKNDFKVKK
jgi:hypothetical protein